VTDQGTFAAVATGLAALLAVVLVVAGVVKLQNPRWFAASMRDLLRWRVLDGRTQVLVAAGRLLGGFEVALGVLLVATSGALATMVAVVSALLFAGFVAVVALAVRRKASCGCWGSLSSSASATAELVRSLLLAVLAAALAAMRLAGATGRVVDTVTLATFVLGAAALVLVGRYGARARRPTLRPVTPIAPWRRAVGWVLGAQTGLVAVADVALPVGPRERHRTLASIRHDGSVSAMAAAVGPVDWSRATVTRRDDAPGRAHFVSVPGPDGDVRVLLLASGAPSVTGRRARQLFTIRDGAVAPLVPPSLPNSQRS